MRDRLRHWFWSAFDMPLAWLLALVFLAFVLIGVSDPRCCTPGPYDDNAQYHRWGDQP